MGLPFGVVLFFREEIYDHLIFSDIQNLLSSVILVFPRLSILASLHILLGICAHHLFDQPVPDRIFFVPVDKPESVFIQISLQINL